MGETGDPSLLNAGVELVRDPPGLLARARITPGSGEAGRFSSDCDPGPEERMP